MSSLGTSCGYHGLRYRSKTCRCGETCAIKISHAKHENGGRLYYACPNDTCNTFGWCLPYRSVGSSIHANWIQEYSSNKRDVGFLTPNDEVMVMVESLSKLEKSISRMKKLLGAALMVGCLVGTLELILLKKRSS